MIVTLGIYGTESLCSVELGCMCYMVAAKIFFMGTCKFGSLEIEWGHLQKGLFTSPLFRRLW
jgi:hypothetical protein